MSLKNPVGTDGFDFLEFTTKNPAKLTHQFESLGFSPLKKHVTQDVTIFQQNDIRFILNLSKNTLADEFADEHGASVCAMGFRVADAKKAFDHVIQHGAVPYTPLKEHDIYSIPAIYGVGGSVIYFVDHHNHQPNYLHQFTNCASTPSTHQCPKLTYIDHVTHNLYRGNMDEWADFYTRLFNFHEVRYFDIEGKLTGLKSRAMTSPCGKIRIPLNESSDDKSQIEEFLKDFNGEGIQHIALGTDNIYESVKHLHHNKIDFLETPATYYEMIDDRLPNHGESIEKLKALSILIDGHTDQGRKLLLQIFTKNMLGPVFFEIIQRKGDEGFGEGNFRALFESIELDQIRRGVLS